MMVVDAWKSAVQVQPDLIIYHPKAMAGPHIAQKLGIPRIMSVPLPIFPPTAEFPSMVFPNLKLGGWYNRLTYTLSVKLAWMQYRSTINTWRKEMLDLPPAPRSFKEMLLVDGQPTPTIYPSFAPSSVTSLFGDVAWLRSVSGPNLSRKRS